MNSIPATDCGHAQEIITTNPATIARSPKVKRRLPKVLDTDQAARLLDFQPQNAKEKRDKAIIELLYGSGLRLMEVVGLSIKDLDLSAGFVTVLGKGNRKCSRCRNGTRKPSTSTWKRWSSRRITPSC